MRIKAYIGAKTPVYEMANGASESIGYIAPNSYVTLTGVKKDGGDSYYITDEYTGYIKKSSVKILRDEDFYYTSSLIRERRNRSKSNRFDSMKRSVAEANYSNIRPSSGGIGISAIDDPMSHGFGSGLAGSSISDGSNDYIIKGYSIGMSAQAQSQSTAPHGPTAMTFTAGLASNVISAKWGNKNPIASFGAQALSSFATTGNWNAVNNMNLGSLAGNLFGGTVGGLFNGATISNLADGSFFNGIFSQNALSLIGNILGTLMQKLDYVVGFNMSGMLLDMFGGFSSFEKGTLHYNRSYDSMYKPARLNINGDLDNRIRQYFKYKGTSYSMTPYSGVLGGTLNGRIDYRTNTMKSSRTSDDITMGVTKVHHNDYTTLYSEFEEDLKKIRSSMSINMSRMDWFYNFNRFRILNPNSVLANSKGYVFFTRPDLNLTSNTAMTSDINLLINSMATYHSGIVASLKKDPGLNGVSFGGHQLIPILCNRCTGLDVNDETLETKEVGDTYTGWKLNYGMNNIKSKAAQTVTTSFVDDEQLSIYLIFKLWTEYISNVSRGIIGPKEEYVRSLQLDYANSIYYFLCGPDGESILFWTKYTGCIPTTSPSSNFSDNVETAIRVPKYSITWQYAFKKDYDPYSLAEFNKVAGCEEGSRPGSMPIFDAETIRAGRTLAGTPWIDTQTGGLYKLHFREPQNTFEPEY